MTDNVEGSCGIEPVATGKGDPWRKILCIPHDADFRAAIKGHPKRTPAETLGQFTQHIATGALQGLYLVATAIPYWLVGGVGGYLRELWITRNK